MQSINRVVLCGHLGRAAETKQTPSGIAVTNFSMATTQSKKDPNTNEWTEITHWHNVVAWRLSDKLTPLLGKGAKVYVEGRLETRSWEGQNGQKNYRTEVITDQRGLMLIKPSKDAPQPTAAPQAHAPQPQQAAAQAPPWERQNAAQPQQAASQQTWQQTNPNAVPASQYPGAGDSDDIPF